MKINRLFHVPINSIYIELVRLRYRGDGYGKYHVRYYSKASDRLIHEEKSVKILDAVKKHWEPWPPLPADLTPAPIDTHP